MTQLQQYLEHLQRFGIRPGLERIRALLVRNGEPHRRYPVVLVGGTNGKGSTCEFLARMLAHEGYRVGLFTSPHLYRWNERIRVLEASTDIDVVFAGTISDDALDALFEKMRPLLEESAAQETLGQPTEFETLTLLGLQHFADAAVDVAVVEVGLGGLWDATNATDPAVSVVTHVALDHCDRLGNTHVEIARDKVEIARPGRVLVTAETRDDVLEVFRAHCQTVGARLWSFRNPSYSNDPEKLMHALEQLGGCSEAGTDERADIQQLNLMTARTARQALADAVPELALSPVTDISDLNLQVAGRFQIVRYAPTIVLDAANNPDGAHVLRLQLERWLRAHPDSRLTLVLGILRDKDYAAMVAELAPLASQIVATQSTSPRACKAEELARCCRLYCDHVEVLMPVAVAVQRALTFSTSKDILCVAGSFYTLAEAGLNPA